MSYMPEDEISERPPRGDVVEIPGDPVAVEYEEVRSPPPWLTPLGIIIVTLFAVFVVARAAVVNDSEPIELSRMPGGSVPASLADGSTLPELPEPISERFAAPVVGTSPAATIPDPLAEQCRTPFTAEQIDPAAVERISGVVAQGQVTDLRLGPEVLSVLHTGPADSPPEWSDTWVLSCLGRLEDGQWAAKPPRLDFAEEGDRGAGDAVPGVVARMATVPEGATWAVHERDGWWLAAPVEPESWVQLIVEAERADAEVRVVFLNDEGDVISDRRLPVPGSGETADAADGEVAPGRRPSSRTLDAGAVNEILAAAQEGPVRRCAEDLGQCVWITRVGSELQAQAAYGPHHLDVPPFGDLGWCPDARRFQGTVTRSQFLPDGEWRAGIADRGADAFPLRFSDGRVIVDLGNLMPGEPAAGESGASTLCVFTDEPVGAVPENPDAIDLLG